MKHFVGQDVSVKETSICVAKGDGDVILQTRVPSEPQDIVEVLAVVNGGGIMLHAERPVGPVAAAQECATHVPLSVRARGGGCTVWSSMRRFGLEWAP